MFTSDLVLSTTQSMSQEELLMLNFLLRYNDTGTQEVYASRLKIFYGWCQQHELKIVHDIKRVHLELYVRYLREQRGNKPTTVRGVIHTLSAFYRMLEQDEIIVRNPASFVNLPKVHDQDIKRPHLNRTQFTDLLAYARTRGSYETCMVLFLGLLGMRVSEVCSLDVSSVSYYEHGYRLVKFTGKGSKPAVLPMPVLLIRELEAYLDTIPGQEPLFCDTTGTRLDRRQMARRIRTLCRNAKVPEVSPHALRRSMVTNSLNAGADIREVQKSARHADVRTTSRIYDRGTPSYDSSSFNILAGYISGAI